MKPFTRRQVLQGAGFSLLGGLMPACKMTGAPAARVVVIGGGFGGMTVARSLKRLSPGLNVTMVEPKQHYVACPFSNLVIGNLRDIAAQTFDYGALATEGIEHAAYAAVDIDPIKHRVTLAGGMPLDYDKLILVPGISLNFDALAGYDESASAAMPHAWLAGEQTLLLAKQIATMKDGGTVVMAVPAEPYRCPPGPYERASLIAHYLRQHKPKSKLLILDSKDQFSKKTLFMSAWQSHYGDMIEWRGVSDGARVIGVDPAGMTLQTDFDVVHADVANVIPPQRAAAIADIAADETGWCPIDAATFASSIVQDVHVIGDAAIANAMPKSAFAANAQAKLCAVQVARLLAGEAPLTTKLINTCYSLVTPDFGISVAGVYQPDGNQWIEVPGAGGTSAVDASTATRRLEADHARHWYATMTREVFG